MIMVPICRVLVKLFGLVGAYKIAIEQWSGRCIHCGHPLVNAGTYRRKTPRSIGPFKIQRVLCSNHALCPPSVRAGLLPSWLLPYQRTTVEVQQAVLENVSDGTWTLETAAERANVEPKTISRWLGTARRCVPWIQQKILGELGSHHSLADWIHDGSVSWTSSLSQLFSLLTLFRNRMYRWFPERSMALVVLFWPYAFLEHRQ